MDNEINLVTTQRIGLLENLSILQTRRGEELLIENAKKDAADLEAELARQKKDLLKRQNKAARKIQKEMRVFLKRNKYLEALSGSGKKKGGDKKGKGKKK